MTYLAVIPYWSCSNPILVLQWSHIGLAVVPYWSCSGPISVLQWFRSGLAVIPYWSCSNPILVLQWSPIGLAVVPYWSCSGPVVVLRLDPVLELVAACPFLCHPRIGVWPPYLHKYNHPRSRRPRGKKYIFHVPKPAIEHTCYTCKYIGRKRDQSTIRTYVILSDFA